MLNDRISAGLTVDGDFGTRTETALKTFQKNNGLDDDGICGDNTWKALEGGQPGPARPVIRPGDTGDTVIELQQLLNKTINACLEADGKYGEKTRDSLIEYQQMRGLSADGICGPQTWYSLENELFYNLDLNWVINGTDEWGGQDCGTADVCINGRISGQNCRDYCTAWPLGTRYEITNITAAPGYVFTGTQKGSAVSGTLETGLTEVWLGFASAEKTAVSLSIASMPDKTTYETGETLNTAGLTVRVYYSDGTNETLSDGFNVSWLDSSSPGMKDITVTCMNQTAVFQVTVTGGPANQDTARISVENKSAAPGSTVQVNAVISGNPGISGFLFEAVYDKSALSLVSAAPGALCEDGSFRAEQDTGLIQWYGVEDVYTDGILFTMSFLVKDGADADGYEIGVKLADDRAVNLSNGNAEAVPVQFASGYLTLRGGVPGDVTGDGIVAINDVVKVARFVAKKTTLTEQEQSLADVTGDNLVAINDVIRIARYAAKKTASLQNAGAVLSTGEGGAVIEVGSVSGSAGEIVSVPVRISRNPGIAGLNFDIFFDETQLVLTDIEQGGVLKAVQGTFMKYVEEKRVQWYNELDNALETGVLFTLKFRVSGSVDRAAVSVGLTDGISANLSDIDSNIVSADFKDGGVQGGEPFSVASVRADGPSVTADVVCPDGDVLLACGIYRDNGQLVSVAFQQISESGTYLFSFAGKSYDYAEAFLVTDALVPLCGSARS